MTTPDDLVNVPILHLPLTLQSILTFAKAEQSDGEPPSGHIVAALLSCWTRGLGTARDALLTAEAGEIGDVIRDYSGWCEECRQLLAAWQPFQTSDHGLTFCEPCAEADRRVNPSQWRTHLESVSA